ncbi:MAG TPA: glycerol-3-phosphate 1-O-acyltransferase PlsY [Syntrophorhabdaceae bacterium]|nr:glycerol-3-phosphate 1-O-acyltransferase PlsY [Syntrophorhabdaceae bacterium]
MINFVLNPLLVVFAYFLGSIPVGVMLGRLKGVDPRKTGSGNIGATNVMRAAGKKLGVVTLILDAAKGFVPVALATLLGVPLCVVALVGLVAFLGHVFPVFLRFKGGKGVATALGVYLAISPVTILAAFVVFVIVAAIWRYVSLASMIGATVVPIGLYLIGAPWSFVVMAVLITLVVIVRHKDNITRLVKGTESKLSFSGGSKN